ncbi:hypothetical protein [Okeania sp. SIO2F5]|nr:hypothetical protein [Okeania sp. SIO2F5]
MVVSAAWVLYVIFFSEINNFPLFSSNKYRLILIKDLAIAFPY